MTLAIERVNSVKKTREFLLRLLDPKKTPRVPKAVRDEAASCLRHYPWDMDLNGVFSEKHYLQEEREFNAFNGIKK